MGSAGARHRAAMGLPGSPVCRAGGQGLLGRNWEKDRALHGPACSQCQAPSTEAHKDNTSCQSQHQPPLLTPCSLLRSPLLQPQCPQAMSHTPPQMLMSKKPQSTGFTSSHLPPKPSSAPLLLLSSPSPRANHPSCPQSSFPPQQDPHSTQHRHLDSRSRQHHPASGGGK